MRKLDSTRRGAKSGNTKSLVVFVHGYGADGADLLGLADPLGEHLPDTVFVAPNAPEKCTGNPFGYQWFSIPRFDGTSEVDAKAGLDQSSQDLNAFLDGLMEEEGVTAENTILFGFSQGTMMSLHIAPRRAVAFAGVVGFSGRLLQPETLGAEAVSKLPILLVHGDQDPMVPFEEMPAAADALVAQQFEVYTHVSKGTAHGIAPDGLGVALQFMRDRLKG